MKVKVCTQSNKIETIAYVDLYSTDFRDDINSLKLESADNLWDSLTYIGQMRILDAVPYYFKDSYVVKFVYENEEKTFNNILNTDKLKKLIDAKENIVSSIKEKLNINENTIDDIKYKYKKYVNEGNNILKLAEKYNNSKLQTLKSHSKYVVNNALDTVINNLSNLKEKVGE